MKGASCAGRGRPLKNNTVGFDPGMVTCAPFTVRSVNAPEAAGTADVVVPGAVGAVWVVAQPARVSPTLTARAAPTTHGLPIRRRPGELGTGSTPHR